VDLADVETDGGPFAEEVEVDFAEQRVLLSVDGLQLFLQVLQVAG